MKKNIFPLILGLFLSFNAQAQKIIEEPKDSLERLVGTQKWVSLAPNKALHGFWTSDDIPPPEQMTFKYSPDTLFVFGNTPFRTTVFNTCLVNAWLYFIEIDTQTDTHYRNHLPVVSYHPYSFVVYKDFYNDLIYLEHYSLKLKEIEEGSVINIDSMRRANWSTYVGTIIAYIEAPYSADEHLKYAKNIITKFPFVGTKYSHVQQIFSTTSAKERVFLDTKKVKIVQILFNFLKTGVGVELTIEDDIIVKCTVGTD